jgi:hypothetical protein
MLTQRILASKEAPTQKWYLQCTEVSRARRVRQVVRRSAESATHVFVEPVDRALPGQIGRGFSYTVPASRRN